MMSLIRDSRIRLVRALRAAFDLRDVFFFGGLAVAGYGGAMLSRPWTLIVVGAVLVIKAHGPLIVTRARTAGNHATNRGGQ